MSLNLYNVTLSYKRHPAVHHISGEFINGDTTAILGPNGAGKSTLLKLIVGLLKADSGHINVADFVKGKIAYLAQQSEIDRSMPLSVFELVCSGLWKKCGIFNKINLSDQKRVNQSLEYVGLLSMSQRQIGTLSTGQFQRVLFARIIVQDAKLILLDEPFSAVDTKTTNELLNIIANWKNERRTVIAVLHDYNQAKEYFAQTLLLAREVVAWGETNKILTDDNIKKAMTKAMFWQEHATICDAD